MRLGERARTVTSIAAAFLGAALALGFLSVLLAGPKTRAAWPRVEMATGDPEIQSIIASSTLPISDTQPGREISRTIYFNNAATGTLTLTLDISGTPTLTLTTGAAFDQPTRTYTSPVRSWVQVVTYSVGTAARSRPGVTYTVVNTDSLCTLALVSYVRDITAPLILSPSVAEDSPYLSAAGTGLYYTNTMDVAQAFEVRGRPGDALAGLQRVQFSPAFGGSPPPDDESPADFAGIYHIPAGSAEAGVITVAVSDWVRNTAIETYTYDLDGAPPHTGSISIACDREHISQTCGVTLYLFAADAGCGVAQMCISDTPQCSAWEEYGTSSPYELDASDGWKTIYVRYRDHLGNTSRAYTDSVLLDSAPPTVTVTAPAYTTETIFPVSWQVTDPEPSSGVFPFYQVSVRRGGGDWERLKRTDQLSLSFSGAQAGQVYDFRVTARDNAGNEGEDTATTRVGPFRVHLPLLARSYPPPWIQAGGTDDVDFYDIAVCPSNVDVQYAGTAADGVYRSSDGGATWEHWAVAGRATPVVVNPTDCDEAFVAVWGSGVQRIAGKGQTVDASQGLKDLYLYGLAISDDGQTLYGGGNSQGVYRTDTSDIDWIPINDGISDLRIRSLYVISDTLYAGGRQCTYYYSEDGGNSWSPETILPGGQGGACGDAQVWALEQIDDMLYASLGADKGLHRRPEGEGWAQVSDVPTVTIFRFGLLSRYSRLYVGTFGHGIYACDPLGRCKPFLRSGLGTSNLRGLAIAEGSDARLLAGSDDGIWWVSLVP